MLQRNAPIAIDSWCAEVFFWFIGTSVLAVWFVFRDPAFDFRLLIMGALLPDLIDGLWGGSRAFHSVTVSVVVLFGVMMTTIGHRRLRRHVLAVPIGMFVHLIMDGAFDDTKVFWWPISGMAFSDANLPVARRGSINIVLEVLGIGACLWIVKRFGLTDGERRREFVRTGALKP